MKLAALAFCLYLADPNQLLSVKTAVTSIIALGREVVHSFLQVAGVNRASALCRAGGIPSVWPLP